MFIIFLLGFFFAGYGESIPDRCIRVGSNNMSGIPVGENVGEIGRDLDIKSLNFVLFVPGVREVDCGEAEV